MHFTDKIIIEAGEDKKPEHLTKKELENKIRSTYIGYDTYLTKLKNFIKLYRERYPDESTE